VAGWRLPVIGFFLYSMIAIGAHIFDAQGFLIVGGAIMFMCVCAEWCRSIMAVSADKSVLLAICILLLSILTTLYDPTNTVFHNFLKNATIFILYIFISSMGLDPVYSTPYRTIFVLVLLFMGLVSLIVPNVSETDNVMRMSGFFVNANNLSLMMMSLLFFINEDKDSLIIKISFHVVVILFLILSGTSGAILAYIGAMIFKYLVFYRSAHRRKVSVVILSSIFLVFLGCLLPRDLYRKLPIFDRIISQISLVNDHLAFSVTGRDLSYGQLKDEYGEESLSGIWRISKWREGFDAVIEANTFQFFFGHGIGSSPSLLSGRLPHNDYLRIALEQGILGLVLNMAFFVILFRQIDRRYRYCVIAIALYCFTENNIDNLLFMTIFMFFLSGSRSKVHSALCYVGKVKAE
jgi:O-antigen ligase